MPVGLQELIHKLEEGGGARYVKLAAVVLGFIALVFYYDLREFKNFSLPAAMEMAAAGRNLSEGDGFTTESIRPLGVYLLQRHAANSERPAEIFEGPFPEIKHPPFYPLLLGGLMKVLPFQFEINDGRKAMFQPYQPELMIALFNQLLLAVVVVMVFRLGLRLFDRSVAWVAAIVTAGSVVLWRFSVSGLPTLLLAVIFLGVFWLLMVLEQHVREGKGMRGAVVLAIGLGLLVGLGGVTRYSFGWMIIPVVGFVVAYCSQRGWRLAGACLLAFAVVMVPWVVRNHVVTGTPFGLAGYSIFNEMGSFQGDRLERFATRGFEVELGKIGISDFVRKLLVDGAEIIEKDLPTLGGSWLAAFFLAGLLVPFRSVALSRLRYFLIAVIAIGTVVQALVRSGVSEEYPMVNPENLLVIFAPAVFLFGAGMIVMLLDQIEFEYAPARSAALSGLVLVLCAPFLLTLLPPRNYPLSYPPYHPPLIQDLAGWLGPDELMMSDVPWAVAWYGDQQCILTTLYAPWDEQPDSGSDFFTLNDYQKAIKALYLSPKTTDSHLVSESLADQRSSSWSRFAMESIVRTNIPTGFPLIHAPAGLLPDHIFLTDYPRWQRALRREAD